MTISGVGLVATEECGISALKAEAWELKAKSYELEAES
jgi:hypothetical protein